MLRLILKRYDIATLAMLFSIESPFFFRAGRKRNLMILFTDDRPEQIAIALVLHAQAIAGAGIQRDVRYDCRIGIFVTAGEKRRFDIVV